MSIKKMGLKSLTILFLMVSINSYSQYTMPAETAEHEGTWLQWPHHYEYGMWYRNSLDDTWVDMTASLVNSEIVHIVAYNTNERDRIIDLLTDASIPLTNVDFYIHENNDVWIRDNGPIFVYDTEDNLVILDWGFNGWGDDTPYAKCDVIPSALATDLGMPAVDLAAMVLEGGAIEIDGNGTMMATKSSITHSSRNPSLTEAQIEDYMTENLGITNFLWLDGVYGLEITDMHIDGFMKFANNTIIVTMNNADLLYWDLTQGDIDILFSAEDVNGEAFDFVYLPLTQNNVTTAYGNALDYKGSYVNYYIANTVVVVPNYNDPNDAVANAILQDIYPNKTVVGIDVRNLYENGGMIHCVVQQQPVELNTSSINTIEKPGIKVGDIYPNPTNGISTLPIVLSESCLVEVFVSDIYGRKIIETSEECSAGENDIEISGLKIGFYTYLIKANNKNVKSGKLIVK